MHSDSIAVSVQPDKLLNVFLLGIARNAGIYIENLRAVYGISAQDAIDILEYGVSNKKILKRLAVVCPTCSRIIKTYKSYDGMPLIIHCDICEALEVDYEFSRDAVQKLPVYLKL